VIVPATAPLHGQATNNNKQELIMSMLGEFKSFAMRGNVVDMAVGIIIGAAFGKIVSSFVNDVIMPPIGVMLGGVNFRDLALVIQQATETQAEVLIKYGMFVQSIIDFIIIALAVFVGVKAMNSMKAKEEAKPVAVAEIPEDVKLLVEIRDLLKKP
tara:strand:- start:6483 stop:6950 length:468 start_codon:yes stop_codon:yes gene_type:complete